MVVSESTSWGQESLRLLVQRGYEGELRPVAFSTMPWHHSCPKLSQLLEGGKKEDDGVKLGPDPCIPNVLSSSPLESLGQVSG